MAEKKDTTEILNQMLKKSNVPLESSLNSEELSCLASAFQTANEDVAVLRPKGYITLSAICRNVRTAMEGRDDGDEATQHLARTFAPYLVQLFGETDEKSLLLGVCFLTALFQVDSLVASTIFMKDGFVEGIMDTIDLSPSPLLSQELARLLGQAVGHRNCRGVITPQIIRWLESKIPQSSDPDLRVLASLALTKLSKAATSDPPENRTPDVQPAHQTVGLMKTMVDAIISGKTGASVDAIEGLAYLTVDPAVRESLARNPTFLKQLFSLVPTKKTPASTVDPNSSLIYGVCVIICNLIRFRPRLSEEQQQLEKLKRMAKAGKESDAQKSLLDGDDYVKARIRLLISAGVLPVFPAAIAASDSDGVRLNVGTALLSIVEEKECRGLVLQAGGAKVLQTIIKRLFHAGSKDTKESAALSSSDLSPIQALAKLAITSSPLQVFGPNVGAIYDAIRPLSVLLQHPSSNLLQHFEAIMALTNLASYNPDVASRIAKTDSVVSKVELLLLENHVLVRRASVELICNLIVGSDEVFERYTGDTASSASKVHILLALSDTDDTPTRLAASGALATLTAAPSTCKVLLDLQFDRHRFLPIMTQLIDPSTVPDDLMDEILNETNSGLINRGVVCVKNVFESIKDKDVRDRISDEGRNAGLLQALVCLAKGEGLSKDPPVMHLAAEALKALA
jgi:myosin-1